MQFFLFLYINFFSLHDIVSGQISSIEKLLKTVKELKFLLVQ